MKKIIIGLAIITAALTSYGASCIWGGSSIAFQSSGDSASSYVAYLVDSSITATDFISALKNGTAEYVAMKSALTGENSARIANTSLSTDARTGAAFVENREYSLYTLILNNDIASATHYYATAVKKGTPTAQANLNMNFGNLGEGDFKGAGWQPIPEPTSGLLLLVGGALLALRRKQK